MSMASQASTDAGSQTMTAAVLAAPRRIEFRSLPMPEPGEGEVRIKLEGCGICGSNLEPWKGREWFNYPFEAGAPGHEGWGRVDKVGPGVSSVKVGARVAALTYHAFAECDIAAENQVVELPRELDSMPFPGEPLAWAINIYRRSAIRSGETVVIVGIGSLGALLTSLAKQAGARVIAITRRPFALEFARRCGADETIQMDDHWRVLSAVKVLTQDRGCDCVIECAGAQWPLDLAAELTRIRGRMIIAGYHQDGPRQVNMQLWNWRGLDVINAHERDPEVHMEGLRLAIDYVKDGKLDPTSLYTHPYKLEELELAMRTMEERPDNYLKGLVLYD
jgi:threonine dehydrogenase-like Zn-dependent dehydrogenase